MAGDVINLSEAREGRTLHMAVASNVRAETARLSVSQKDIAAALGKTQQVVSSKMRGQTPFQLNELAVIAPMLQMSVLELIAGVRDPRLGGDPTTPAAWAPWGSNPQPAVYTSSQVTNESEGAVIAGPWPGSGQAGGVDEALAVAL